MTLRANHPYSIQIREAAAAWGLTDVDDDQDPRMDLDRVKAWTHKSTPTRVSHLILLRRGSLWSFCLNLQTRCWGLRYGPKMRFCEPYPSRDSALTAACQSVEEIALRQARTCTADGVCDCSDSIVAWARDLEPQDTLSLW